MSANPRDRALVVRRGPARRAVLRWARRLFRREWRQQLLVLTLLTVAVTAAVAITVVAVNGASRKVGEFGGASLRLDLDGSDPALATAGIEEARERYGTIDVIAESAAAIPGSLQQLSVRDQDPAGPFSGAMISIVAGRLPTTAAEIALTQQMVELFDTSIGGEIEIDDTTRTVVGVIENPGDLSDDFGLVAPGTLARPQQYAVLADGVAGFGPGNDISGQVGVRMQGQAEDDAIIIAVFAAATLALTLAGLVAAAGFMVVAQRRQRQLGLLAAIGANDRHVRLVMIANGAIVGAVAAVTGTVLGIGIWLVSEGAVETAAARRIDSFDLPVGLILGVATLAFVVAVLAAWWPARVASRLPVVAALSGRPRPPRSVHRSLLLALVLTGGGVWAISISRPMTRDIRPLAFIAGLFAAVIGVVFATPAAIRGLGVLAARLPFSPRLALRDLARYQSRAASALAAITLGHTNAVSIIVISAASEQRSDGGNLSDRQLVIHVAGLSSKSPTATPTVDALTLDRGAAAVIAALGSDVSSAPLDIAFDNGTRNDVNGQEPISIGRQVDENTFEFLGTAYVATPELLQLYGIDVGSVRDDADLFTKRSGDVSIIGIGRETLGSGSSTQRTDALPSYGSAPNSLITTAAMERHDLRAERAGWIVESPHPFTADQRRAARDAAADAGLAIEVRDSNDALVSLRRGATAVGALLALAIVAMAVGLIRGEVARDIRTLTATGASSMTRRALTASTAAALALPGVALAVMGSYAALIAAYRSHLDKLATVPVASLATLVVGVPLAATIVGWLVAGREPRTFASRALD